MAKIVRGITREEAVIGEKFYYYGHKITILEKNGKYVLMLFEDGSKIVSTINGLKKI